MAISYPRRGFKRRRFNRRGRYYPRYWHPNFRRHQWWRTRRRYHAYRRRRTEVLREIKPKHQRTLIVRGWEILGSVGSIFTWTGTGGVIKQMIKCNNECSHLYNLGVTSENKNDPTRVNNTCEYKHFCGGYGGAWFTWGGLVLRAKLGMCRFSLDPKGFTWIKFLGGTIYLRRGLDVSYLYRWNTHHGGESEHNREKKWVTPGIMLNQPGHRTVLALKHTNCCKSPKIRVSRPEASSGWNDIGYFYDLLLGGYYWTVFDPFNPLGKRSINKQNKDVSIEHQRQAKYGSQPHTEFWYTNFWWRDNVCGTQSTSPTSQQPLWTNRKIVDKRFVDASENENDWNWWEMLWGTGSKSKFFEELRKPNYSPFLPPVYPASQQNTLWFQYKFRFKLGGDTLENIVPDFPIQEVREPPGGNCSPGDRYDLRPEDLDADGFIKERKFRFLTRPLNRRQRMLLKLKEALREKLKQKRVKWGTKRIYRYHK
ncbi:MAG: ORF1 protein [Anelloviridae sp.]|uniref:ORF1 protein n=1 Tax=Anelloviridae sp. TaxID=2055263 RepID=A0A3G2YSV8_9VIRU|nr:MAG: ORF1 protein [Anelloviridae sp.]AYP28725.1 MAG: ORF1 protein [Anelloviridae sp.]